MSFVRQFFIYGIAGAASRLAAVVLVPLYTRTLAIAEYGQLEVWLATHTLIVVLAGLQVESAVARDYMEAKSSGSAGALARCAFMLTAFGTAAISIGALLAWWSGWLPKDLHARDLGL